MKKYLNLLAVVMLLSLLNSCDTTNSEGPDTGDDRDKYVGTWLFTENSPARQPSSTYTAVISKDPSNSSQVLISNFTGVGSGSSDAYGIVTSGSISVPQQNIATDYKVEGFGSSSTSTKMNWTYSVTAGGSKDDYSATATKQN
jgi:hypothetical protein